MPKVSINGRRIHYQQMGQGRDLVLIHGLFSNLAFWYLTVMPALARDFRVTAYDLRGHGITDMPKDGYTTYDLALDLRALLDCLGVHHAHVAGHSFGSAIALHHAVLHPERVRSLILADARIHSLQPALPRRRAPYWKLLKWRLRRVGVVVPRDLPRVAYSFLEELAQLKRTGTKGDSAPDNVASLNWNGHSRLAKRWNQLVQTTSAPRDFCEVSGLTVERIRQVRQPTLAIFGEHSNCLATLRGLKGNLPRCKEVIVPGVGHLHPMLKPETFVEKLRQFILSLEE